MLRPAFLAVSLCVTLAVPVAHAAPLPVPGSIVALYQRDARRFVRLGANGVVDGSEQVASAAAVPANGSAIRFRVVDGGGGTLAFQSLETRRFLRLTNDNKANSAGPVDALPADWKWERMTVTAASDGTVRLFNGTTKRYLRMAADGSCTGLVANLLFTLPAPLSFELVPLPTPVGDGVVPVHNCASGSMPFADELGRTGCRAVSEVRALQPGAKVILAATDTLTPTREVVHGPVGLAGIGNARLVFGAPDKLPFGFMHVLDVSAGFLDGTVRLESDVTSAGLAVAPDGTLTASAPHGAGDLFRVVDQGGVLSLRLVRPLARGFGATKAEDLDVREQCVMPVVANEQVAALATDQVVKQASVDCGVRTWFRIFQVVAPH